MPVIWYLAAMWLSVTALVKTDSGLMAASFCRLVLARLDADR